MITIENVKEILKDSVREKDKENLNLMNSLGRILGEDVSSDIEMPPFDKSAMDGFAVNSRDTSERFRIVETIPAGKFPVKKIGKGECSKIMTGAPLPEGADRVVKVEVTEEKDGFMYIKGEDRAFNVCIRGEDIKRGEVILKKGQLLNPQHVGILASLGKKDVRVFKKVSVGVISTGSEIVEPGNKLNPGNIYNSNLYSVSSQVLNSGFELSDALSVRDDLSEIRGKIAQMAEKSDVLLISGGVSMGDFDYVPEVLKEIGFTIHFHRVAIKPGRPTLFASGMNRWIFGLPGNPVSTFVVFEILVKPFLFALGGHDYSPVILKGILRKGFKRKKTERDLFVPVMINDKGYVELLEYHGSAHLRSLEKANALLKIDKGVSELHSGSEVYVRQI